jgi:hypothetical protein
VVFDRAAGRVPRRVPPFLFADSGQRKLFDQLHGELYNADYWKGLQEAIRAGKVIDVFPYRRKGLDNEWRCRPTLSCAIDGAAICVLAAIYSGSELARDCRKICDNPPLRH